MKPKYAKSVLMMILMLCASLAGCLDAEEEEEVKEETSPDWLDASDAGYTYASNVDNHRSLMKDLCDIKSAASSDGGYDFATAKDIYMNGKNAEKDDGSFRTLHGFASATGKNHGYDSYYGADGSVDAHIMAALDGTGDFEGTSDTVRYQGIAKLTVNMGMVAYTIHELNSAISKADAGNVDNDSGAPHNWDEGWAFFHGPDEDWGCSPAYVMKKRAADFGTETDGVSNALSATEAAMVDGLTALQAEDQEGYTGAADTVVKNLIITYSQATLKYTAKMDSNESAEKYQAEGYAFWKAIEAYSAQYTDGCYNTVTHVVDLIGDYDAAACDEYQYYENMSTPGGGTYTGCYNMATHQTTDDDENSCNNGYSNATFMDMYGAQKINEILNLQDSSQLGTSYDIAPHLEHVWSHYGITSEDIGTYS
tara:strand:+ start:1143 stop:2411 length:1269 start_codon:yes stop_codon:yes gene_type:complete